MKSPRILLLVLCVVALLLTPLAAQKTTGNIVGVVSDASGAVVANAQVTATNNATGQSRTAVTDPSGNYRLPELEPGIYKISVKAASFKETVVNNLEVHVANTTPQNFTLQVGGGAESVEVSADAIQVQTDTATLGDVINSTQVRELPLNGRSFVQLTQLAPGVSAANNFDAKQKGLTGGVDFSVNGNSVTNNLFLVDGANNNDVGSNRTILIYPSIESIQEFKMLRNSYGPEYGQASGGVVTIVTKGGSNQFHGSAFYSGRNDALNSYDFFTRQQANVDPSTRKGKLRRHDYGFSVGGPIWKDRLFFFASEEWNKEKRGVPVSSCVPTAAEKAGDFSNPSCGAPRPNIPAALQAAGNPYKIANPAQVGMLLAARFPDPNLATPVNGNNWALTTGRKTDWRQDNGRIDYAISKNNTLMGRFTQDHWEVPAPTAGLGWGDDPFPILTSNWKQPSKMIVGKLSSTLGNTMVNDAEFAYSNNRINISVGGTNPGLLAQINKAFPPLYPESMKNQHLGLPVLWGSFQQYGNFGNYWVQAPWSNKLDIYTFRDDFSKVAGSHTWKAGLFFGWDRKDEDIGNPGAGERPTFGSADWAVSGGPAPTGTGNALANVMIPGEIFQLNENSTNIRGKMKWRDYEFYVGDTWKAHKQVTVEYGVRYSLLFTPYDADNRGASFQPWLYNPSRPTTDACNGMWVIPGTDPCGAANKQFGTTYSTAAQGPNKYLVNQNHHLFAPRLGIAWDPFGSGTTAVRAGIGQFFQRERVSPYFIFPNNAPFSVNSGNVNRALDAPTPANLSGSASPQGGRSPEDLVPNSWQWNLSVEHSFAKETALQIGYVGNRAIHQTSSYDLNRPDQSTWAQGAFLANGSTAFNALRPYSNFGELGYWIHAGNANYHSLQALFKTRYKRSQLTAAYTWSHSIADVLLDDSSGSPNGVQEFTYYPNTALDRGNSAINRPHMFVANFTFFFPDMKGSNGFVQNAIGGWEISAISQAQSGNSQSVYIGGLGENTTNLATGQSSTLKSLVGIGRLDMLRPLVTGQACDEGRNANQIFNPNAFTLVGWKIGTIPSNMAPRGYCHGPRLINTDLSLNKNWKVKERMNMQFRVDFFDLFNHPNFRGNALYTGNPFSGFNCGPATGGKYQACSPTNNVVSSVTRTSNFGLSNALVGDTGRELQYSLKFTF